MELSDQFNLPTDFTILTSLVIVFFSYFLRMFATIYLFLLSVFYPLISLLRLLQEPPLYPVVSGGQ
jgi:hypothetical protein